MVGLGSSSSGIRVGCAFKPQLADQCKSFELPVRKYPSGFLVEVKYDGERVQVHMLKSGEVRFFTRAGKAVPEHKTSGVADALRRAFPGRDREIILDSEVVMRARDGTVLAFGAQGIHEQKSHDGARAACWSSICSCWMGSRSRTCPSASAAPHSRAR